MIRTVRSLSLLLLNASLLRGRLANEIQR
ncbi:leu operon leader peptide [Enterobacter sp. 638]|uniref:leu operon leader peptide n=1 Tax=Pseudomonas tritici TaxID=2745518 RepID=A0A8H9YNG7_9PSED|nr:leu operon leader peptide [Lelliottia amnigena]